MFRFAFKPAVGILFLSLASLLGCNNNTPATGSGATQTFGISGSSSVLLGKTVQFTAANGSASSWTVNGTAGGSATTGTISSTGLYSAPAVLPSTTALVIGAVSGSTSATANLAIQSDVAVALAAPAANPILTASTVALTATIASAGAPSTAVTWTVGGIANGNSALGTINVGTGGAATYTAPAVQPSASVQIIATSVADPSKSSSLTRTVQGIVLSAGTATPGTVITVQGNFNAALPVAFTFSDGASYSKVLSVNPDSASQATIVVPMYMNSSGTVAQGTIGVSTAQGSGTSTATIGSSPGFVLQALPVAAGNPGDATLAVLSKGFTLVGEAQHDWAFMNKASGGVVNVTSVTSASTDATTHLKSMIASISTLRNGGAATQIGTVGTIPLMLNAAALTVLDGMMQAFVINPGATTALSYVSRETLDDMGVSGNTLTPEQALRLYSAAQPRAVSPSSIFTFLASAALAVAATATGVAEVAAVCMVISAAIIYLENNVIPGMQQVLTPQDPTPNFASASASAGIPVTTLAASQVTLSGDEASLLADDSTFKTATDPTNQASAAATIVSDLKSIATTAATLVKSLGNATLAVSYLQTEGDGTIDVYADIENGVPNTTYTLVDLYGISSTITTADDGGASAFLYPLPKAASGSCTNDTFTLKLGVAPIVQASGCFGPANTWPRYISDGMGGTLQANGVTLAPYSATYSSDFVICSVPEGKTVTVSWNFQYPYMNGAALYPVGFDPTNLAKAPNNGDPEIVLTPTSGTTFSGSVSLVTKCSVDLTYGTDCQKLVAQNWGQSCTFVPGLSQ